jgi:hypothetical protein
LPNHEAAGFACGSNGNTDCDNPDTCDGSGSCALNNEPAGTACTDDGEVCTIDQCNAAGSCTHPAGNAGTQCRVSAGSCDVAEACNGSLTTCPPDALVAGGTPCRPATGDCDIAETCSGSSPTCPADALVPDGTTCDDGNLCTTPDVCAAGICEGTANADGCADDFFCYQIKSPRLPSVPPAASLVDQFEMTSTQIHKMRNLCTPADKAGEGVLDPVIHQVGYRMRNVPGTPRHVKRTVKIENQLGTIFLTTIKPEVLLVPANKNLLSQPPAPDNDAHNVDHYKCYKAKVTTGAPAFPRGILRTVSDQFRGTAATYQFKRPVKLCVPVNKAGEGIKNPDAHLVCYSVRGVSGTPRLPKVNNIRTASQFGDLTIGTIREKELCIPSIKRVVP